MFIKLINWLWGEDNRTDEPEDGIWSLVGNIVEQHEFGEEKEIRIGTKHFPPGTKVYCIPKFGGMGHERIEVIGIPRKSSRYIKVVISTQYITNWRVKKVYHPYIRKVLIENWHWRKDERSNKEALSFAKFFKKHFSS